MKVVIVLSIIKDKEMDLDHLVKYFMAIKMSLHWVEEEGVITPMRSRPHWEKGHGEMIMHNALEGC